MLKFTKIILKPIMKNLNIAPYLLIAFLMFTVSSCDNEPLEGDFGNAENSNNSELLIGDWDVMSFSATTASTMIFMDEEIVSSSIITGLEFDYIITFTDSEFSTNGDYQMNAVTELNGVIMDDTTMSYTDVNGSGSYSTNGNLITFDGLLFDLEIDGVDTSVFETNQVATYQLSSNNNVLTVTQTQEQTQVVNDMEIVTVIESITVLERI